ncbi:MAG: hypothetical protein ACOVOD_07565 [Rhodoferax sp.]
MKLQIYLSSPSVRLGIGLGVVMYLSYATAYQALTNVFLISVCLFIGLGLFALGLLSDGRAMVSLKKGIAVFFGAFNPDHTTHLALIREAKAARGHENFYLHCTGVRRLYGEVLK